MPTMRFGRPPSQTGAEEKVWLDKARTRTYSGGNPMAIDPVCKMEVDPEKAQWKSDYRGQTYYFCAPGCKSSFDKDPEKFLSGDAQHGHHH